MPTTLEYKCPSCGGAIEFNSSAQKMKCPYCDSEFEIDVIKALYEDDMNTAPDNMTWDTTAGSDWQDGEANSFSG